MVFSMNLIPEYDPAVYGSSMALQTVSATVSDDNTADPQESDQNMTESNAATDHYSSSYLDTYSTLMDIPQTFLHREMDDDDENAEDRELEQPQITVISAVSQHKSTPAMLGNMSPDRSEERDGKEQDSDRDRDRDRRDRSHSDADRSDEDGSGDDGDGRERNGDGDGDEREEQRQRVMDNIVERLNAMEQRMDTQFQTINARLTILEGKVKFIESQKPRSTTTPTMTTSKSQSESKGESSSAPPSRPRPDTEDNHTFAESTIGSSSLPISLTPAPRAGASRDRSGALRNGNKLNATTFPIQSTLTSQTVNRPISASVPRPKHIHAPTARSPFLGNALPGTSAISGYSGYTSSLNHTVGSDRSGSGLSNGYRGNVMCDVMRYPVSSSSSNGNGGNLKLAERVPRIQPVRIPSTSTDDRKEASATVSAGGGTEDEADNTLNFIEELREMLKSTDKLLRAKPMDLYDSNM